MDSSKGRIVVEVRFDGLHAKQSYTDVLPAIAAGEVSREQILDEVAKIARQHMTYLLDSKGVED